MKLKISNEQYDIFKRAINVFNQIIPKKIISPIYEMILFKVRDKTLTLTAHNGDDTVICNIDDIDCDNMECLVHFKHIQKLTNGSYFQITRIDKMLRLFNGRTRVSIPEIDVIEFPNLTYQDYGTDEIEFSPGEFIGIKNAILHTLSNDDFRPAITGVFFNKAEIIGTDSFRVCILKIDTTLPESVIIRPTTFLIVSAMESDSITLTMANNALRLTDGRNFTIHTKVIAEIFPPYHTVVESIPEKPDKLFEFNTSEFKNRLKELSNFTNSYLELVIKNSILHVSGSDISNESMTVDFKMPIKTNITESAIKINGNFLLDLINVIEDESMTLSIHSDMVVYKNERMLYLIKLVR